MVKDDQSTFISQRYLWAVGLSVEDFPPGSILSDRYRVVESQVVSDTQIFKLPDIPDEIPPYISAYLRMAKFPLHFPSPYGLVKVGENENTQELLLLDRVPISPEGKLYANVKNRWIEGSALRQIDLMGQILRLWQPLLDVGMVSTLIAPETLRVFGPWVRILELIVDEDEVKLSDLGNLWIDWLEHAKPEISDVLADFCYGLSRSEFGLERAIATLDQIAQKQAQTLPISIRIASGTDTGPRRDHNEDSCYPTPERQKRSQQPKVLRDRLAIICDGLGGHEGGEVASDMAIKTIEKELEAVFAEIDNSPNPFNPQEFIQNLDRVVRIANDQIVALNDRYQKQAQQRMGTTLVMAAIPYPHEVYIVNIGDSRLYWIHSESSDRVTVDDDVSTRDVLFGYSFPAIAAQRVDGGSLIQALGTRGSDVLYPRIQRLPLDEDCLLLLCSDGLSDYDRIEEVMDMHIRPILTNNLPLQESVKKLINLANERNGHDNVTVALIRSQLSETLEDIEDEDPLPTEEDQFHGFFGEDLPLSASTSSNLDSNVDEKNVDTSVPHGLNLRLVITGALVLLLLLTGTIAISQFKPVKDFFQQLVPNGSAPK